MISIQGILVDYQALLAIETICDPRLCQGTQSCCERYEVCAEEEELEDILGLLPEVSERCQALCADDEPINPFEEQDDGLFSLDTDDQGLCVLAFRDNANCVRCSLHERALALGLSPYRIKPKSCSLWPLALCDLTPKILTVDQDALALPCTRLRQGKHKRLHTGVQDIIQGVFGADFLAELQTRCCSEILAD